MAERISITASDGHVLSAWKSEPVDEPAGGIVFLQAIYGLTSHLGNVCDWFAADSFSAIAPATYDRTERDRVFAYDREGMIGGTKFRENLTEPTVTLDVAACVHELRKRCGKVAISGFCTGGTWAWICANAMEFDAAVIFYGSDVYDEIDRAPACPTILHYGDRDHVVPIERVEAIRDAHPACELHVYPGAGHAFYNPEQEHYGAAAARLAHARSVDFLKRAFAG